MVHDLVVARERDIDTIKANLKQCSIVPADLELSSLSGDHYAKLPSNNLSQTAFELCKPKENSGRQQLSGAPHATHAKSVDKHVRRELDCTPTLQRINTDYDPGSVVAQSNQPTAVFHGSQHMENSSNITHIHTFNGPLSRTTWVSQ